MYLYEFSFIFMKSILEIIKEVNLSAFFIRKVIPIECNNISDIIVRSQFKKNNNLYFLFHYMSNTYISIYISFYIYGVNSKRTNGSTYFLY